MGFDECGLGRQSLAATLAPAALAVEAKLGEPVVVIALAVNDPRTREVFPGLAATTPNGSVVMVVAYGGITTTAVSLEGLTVRDAVEQWPASVVDAVPPSRPSPSTAHAA